MDYYKKFIKSDPEKTLNFYREKDAEYWKKTGEKMALKLFREAAERVPAYKKFLKKKKVDPKKIKSIKDFNKVPLTDKPNYINKYKLNELCWDGKLETSTFLSASSGSTGVPNYWPRSPEQTYHGALISELIYKEYLEVDKKPTLYIVGFAMGMWIAGTYMTMATDWVAQKGYPVTIATPGLNKDEILRLIQEGAKYYKQIIVIGYPPFIKDVVDTAEEKKVNLKKANLKFMFSGEAFTERWRAYLSKKTGLKNPLTDTINIYGSADVGLVAHETPLTNLLRDITSKNLEMAKDVFGQERVPSVNQFSPELRYFEKVDQELIVTSRGGLPLVRYNTKDIGNVLSVSELRGKLKKYGVDLNSDLKSRGVNPDLIWNIPIVYLFGRGRFSATVYGVTIFSEYVKYCLDNDQISKNLTGKYIISSEETGSYDQALVLRVEMQEKIKASKMLAESVKKVFVKEIPRLSTEYRELLSVKGRTVHPKVYLHYYGDPEYFPRGIIKKTA